MATRSRGLVRLLTVVATISGMLLPAAVAGAQVSPGCGGAVYDPTDPDHAGR